MLSDRYPPDIGGLAISAGRIAGAISQLGITVQVLVWSRQLASGQISKSIQAGITVWRIGMYRQWDMTLPITLNWLDQLHTEQAFSYVWGHYLFPGGFTAVYWGKLRGIASIVSVRGNDIDRGLFPNGDFARLVWTLQQADYITSVSTDLARKVQIVSGRPDAIVLKNAVDTDLFQPACPPVPRATLGISPNSFVLGFVGELREKKGQKYLLEAWAKLRQQSPVHLLIIGAVREEPDSPLLSMDTTGLTITGHLSDRHLVAQHLQVCNLFVLPSLWEGLPNALLEAMASGLCCLASNAGGIPEVITHGRDGFIIPCTQLDQLATAIDEFRQLDPTHQQRIRQQARQKILTEFSPSAEQQRLTRLFAQIDKERSALDVH